MWRDAALLAVFSSAVFQLSVCSRDGTCSLEGWGGVCLLVASLAIHTLRMTKGDVWVAGALGYTHPDQPTSAPAAPAAPAAASPDRPAVVGLAPPLPAPPRAPRRVLVTGVALGLPVAPGRDPFNPGPLWRGERLIRGLSEEERAPCLAVDAACPVRLGAVLPPLSITSGLSPKVAATMDSAALWAVEAGVRACRAAGILDPEGRLLPELRDGCGVVLSSSFAAVQPALRDAGLLPRFERKTLIGWLSPASSQLAGVLGARGPATAGNNTCAGTTFALAQGLDWIRGGRCQTVVVVSSDDGTSPTMLPWLANGFAQLGVLSDAGNPGDWVGFSGAGDGFVLGAGASALVLQGGATLVRPVCELVRVETGNHGAPTLRLDCDTTERVMSRALEGVAPDRLLYLAHETRTAMCADAELGALRAVYGDRVGEVLVTGIKGQTGHSMGNCFEDGVAALSLARQEAPGVAGLTDAIVAERHRDIAFARGGADEMRGRDHAAHFSAGFGSHYSTVLFARV